jgi:hypothetical protein
MPFNLRAHIRGSEYLGGYMSGVVIVGAQWGDEGKGKIVLTSFAAHADMVVQLSRRGERRPHLGG